MRGTASTIGICALGLMALSCDPPGRPKAEDAQAENRQSILNFQTLFQSNCSGCHGIDGRNGPARILNDPLYLAIIPRETLHNVLATGRPQYGMPAWSEANGGPLTGKQIDALVNGIYSTWGRPAKLSGEIPHYSAGDNSGSVDSGKKLFGRNCFACHGPGAPVGSVTDPAYLTLVSDQMLRTSIIVGRPDLGMPDYRNLNLGRALSDQNVTDLVAYLVSKRPPGLNGASTGAQNSHVNESGSGQGEVTKGNEGSGNGPGPGPKREREGNKGKGSSSQAGVK